VRQTLNAVWILMKLLSILIAIRDILMFLVSFAVMSMSTQSVTVLNLKKLQAEKVINVNSVSQMKHLM